MNRLDVVILAAGLGSRLSSMRPKCLNMLPDGRTILEQQVGNVHEVFGERGIVTIVVGFRPETIMGHMPCARFVYNERFRETNTNRSLLRGLELTEERTCLWMNGDVVFAPEILARLAAVADDAHGAIAVNRSRVAEEEVKYTVDSRGHIEHLSKQVPLSLALGEAVGVNMVSAAAKDSLAHRLGDCDDQDYFERAIELGIEHDGSAYLPVDVSDLCAVEVDTAEDLQHARTAYAAMLQGRQHASLLGAHGDSRVVSVDR